MFIYLYLQSLICSTGSLPILDILLKLQNAQDNENCFFFKTLHDENSKCTGCLSQLDLPLELQNTQDNENCFFFSKLFMMKIVNSEPTGLTT